MSTPIIDSFRGEYAFLSNFHPARVKLASRWYPTVENAYQAAKSTDPEYRKHLSACSPSEAKRWGKTVFLKPNWGSRKLAVMRKLLAQKFWIPELREKLLATGDAHLVEGNTWGDTFWGICNGVGENHLGRMLMAIRETKR